ncbi:hypothetical protein E4U52_005041 [Claviceps spartinae]|nr:hypothetical protein E4U52_005041 [Claviceps spartinae]KAG6109955.1 hypothetical protein E4U31_006348 [Claviceps sp. LM219 group G6]
MFESNQLAKWHGKYVPAGKIHEHAQSHLLLQTLDTEYVIEASGFEALKGGGDLGSGPWRWYGRMGSAMRCGIPARESRLVKWIAVGTADTASRSETPE